jgi:tetratricopeptide (TPR) repeat protein
METIVPHCVCQFLCFPIGGLRKRLCSVSLCAWRGTDSDGDRALDSSQERCYPERMVYGRLLALSCGLALFIFAQLSWGATDTRAELQRADQLEDSDRLIEALQVLKAAEQSDPENPEILYRISNVNSELVDVTSDKKQQEAYAQTALKYAKRAVEKGPNSSHAHLSLAIAAGKITDFVDNRTKMEYARVIEREAAKAIQLNPKNDLAYLVLAKWNFEMSNLNPILRGIAQMIYGQVPPSSQEKAVEYFKKAISIAPNQIVYHFSYAQALDQMGKKEEARTEYQKVLQLTATDREDREDQKEAAKALKR